MSMHAVIEREATVSVQDESSLYPVKSPAAADRGAIHHNLGKAWSEHLRQISLSPFLSASSTMNSYSKKLIRLAQDPSEIFEAGTEPPSSGSINVALCLLRGLLAQGVEPENVSLSADGGVSIRFKPETHRRMYVEVLNDGSRHILRYDAQGHVQIFQLAGSSPMQMARRAAKLLDLDERVIATAGAY